MWAKRWSWLFLSGLLVLAGCGRSSTVSSVSETPSSGGTELAGAPGAAGEAPGSPGALGSPVTNGCWTNDQGVAGGGPGADLQWSAPAAMTIDPAKTYRGTIQTSKGSFQVDLFPGEAPLAVNNFVCLARAGYFDGTIFHRVVPGFVIQGGDPTATGRGNPGYQFPDEPITRDYATGTLAMANSGPNTNGSQFFVVLEGGATKLQKLYTIFGQVTAGQDVVEAIGRTDPSVEQVALESVTIVEE